MPSQPAADGLSVPSTAQHCCRIGEAEVQQRDDESTRARQDESAARSRGRNISRHEDQMSDQVNRLPPLCPDLRAEGKRAVPRARVLTDLSRTQARAATTTARG